METEERERKEFEKALGWSKFSKEDTTRVELGEIRHQTVTGFILQEILPHHLHLWINQIEMDPHLRVTQSSSTVYTMQMQMKGPSPDPRPNAHKG
jgi:hypothetical protein